MHTVHISWKIISTVLYYYTEDQVCLKKEDSRGSKWNQVWRSDGVWSVVACYSYAIVKCQVTLLLMVELTPILGVNFKDDPLSFVFASGGGQSCSGLDGPSLETCWILLPLLVLSLTLVHVHNTSYTWHPPTSHTPYYPLNSPGRGTSWVAIATSKPMGFVMHCHSNLHLDSLLWGNDSD